MVSFEIKLHKWCIKIFVKKNIELRLFRKDNYLVIEKTTT